MKTGEELILLYPEVTIMFCQICDFSKIVKRLSPESVVRLLNIIYSAFDRIADKNHIYKGIL